MYPIPSVMMISSGLSAETKYVRFNDHMAAEKQHGIVCTKATFLCAVDMGRYDPGRGVVAAAPALRKVQSACTTGTEQPPKQNRVCPVTMKFCGSHMFAVLCFLSCTGICAIICMLL